ncbi:MAG: hypothetical protein ACKVH8_03430 [Pirellulales bacterium]
MNSTQLGSPFIPIILNYRIVMVDIFIIILLYTIVAIVTVMA